MNIIKAELKHVFFEKNKIDLFQAQIDGFITSVYGEEQKLKITIEGRDTQEKAHDLLMDLLCIFFLYLGGFPRIVKIEADNVQVDTEHYVNKYHTWNYFMRNDLAFCNINTDTINDQIVQRYKKIPQMPLFSFQYLVSENYQHVLVPHRITLLLHIIDGIIPDEIIKRTKKEIKDKYHECNESIDNIGNYMAKAYYLCRNHFFRYDKTLEWGILSILQTSEYEFLQTISHTRNWYSHFCFKNKPHKLEQGEDMMIYFQIVFDAIRLYLIDEMRITLYKDAASEYFYKIHDWISEVYELNRPLKSKTYQINRGIKQLYEFASNARGEKR